MYESSDEEMETGDNATPSSPTLPPRVPRHDLMMVEEVSLILPYCHSHIPIPMFGVCIYMYMCVYRYMYMYIVHVVIQCTCTMITKLVLRGELMPIQSYIQSDNPNPKSSYSHSDNPIPMSQAKARSSFFKQTKSFPMFPCHEDKVSWDEYGEAIR